MTTPQNQLMIQGVTVASADYLNTLVQWVPNANVLRTFIGQADSSIFLLGVGSPNDGGQGMFYWNTTVTSADDGNNIIRPPGLLTGGWIRSGVTGVVSSFNTRTGAVTLLTDDITGAGGAPAASPVLTGIPTAPTATAGTATTQLATTQFVTNAVGTGAPLSWAQNDLIPALHLTGMSGTGPKVIDVLGDSTSIDTGNNNIDDSQELNIALKAAFLRANPHLSIAWINRAIGGTAWTDPLSTGTAIDVFTTLPPWFTDPSKTWISYVQNDLPDVLIVVFGTNASSSGAPPSITTLLTAIAGFTKIPNVIMVTPKINNTTDSVHYQQFIAIAAYIRTLCRSNARGFTTIAPLKFLGLIDIGRYYTGVTQGFDPALQYLELVPSAQVSNVPLINGVSTPLAQTANGDFAVTLVFPGMGAAGIYNAGGTSLVITIGDSVNNNCHITFDVSGGWHTLVQSASAADGFTGPTIIPPAGDVTLYISCKAERIVVKINGTSIIETYKARYYDQFTPAITLYNNTGSVTMNVQQFLQGIALQMPTRLTASDWFGALSGPDGGNALNHEGSKGNANGAWSIIERINFSAPPIVSVLPTSDPLNFGQIWNNGGVLTVSVGTKFVLDFIANTAVISGGAAVALSTVLTVSRAITTSYAQNVDGSWVSFGANTLRLTTNGLLIEGQRTNIARWCRDLTNAVWVKTNITAALDQTGFAGSPNAASSILATAGNATVSLAITDISTPRVLSVFVKRLVGSGTLLLSMDGGATYTDITTASATYVRQTVPAQTVVNPQIIFRITTTGDKFAVDVVQLESTNDVSASSPIPTTTAPVTRQSDQITMTSPPLFGNYLTVDAEWELPPAMGTALGTAFAYKVFQIDDGSLNNAHEIYTIQGAPGNAGASGNTIAGGVFAGQMNGDAVYSSSAVIKAAYAVAPTDRAICSNGGVVSTSSIETPPAGLSILRFGMDQNQSASLNSYLRKFTFFPYRVANPDLVTMTT